jgi:hypothetical protein
MGARRIAGNHGGKERVGEKEWERVGGKNLRDSWADGTYLYYT